MWLAMFVSPAEDDFFGEVLQPMDIANAPVLGKQLGSRWFLGLSTGLCFVNPSAFKENLGLQLEYRISSVYSAQAAIEPGSSNTTCNVKGTTPTFSPTQTPSQLGFDLFRNWRF